MGEKQELSGTRVLIVEDDYLIAHDLCKWLEEAGADVVGPVSNAAQALDLLCSSSVDAAVIDINLGAGPDYEVAEHLTQLHVPFLFATGYDQQVIPRSFGNHPVLEKPFNPQQLVRSVCELR